MEKKQLTQEELKQIKDLQSQYSKIYFETGELEVEKRNLQEKLDNLKIQQDYLFLDLKKIQEKEAELSKILNEKYDKGVINIDTGEVTPLNQ